jgi:hypothetical protein
MTDAINTLPWEGFAYKITDRPCIHFKDERHRGDCSVCVREVLVEVAEKAAKDERERIWKLFHDEAQETALGAEDVARGASVFNWAMWAARKIRDSKID